MISASNSAGVNKNFHFYLFLILSILIATGRVIDIYIEHDDWDFMIQPEFSQYATPWSKTLSEGRWITFLWSNIAIHLSPRVLFFIFMTGYSLLCWKLSALVTNNSIKRLITGLVFFSCPLYSSFSTWPATTTPSVWVALLSLMILSRYFNNYIVYLVVSFTMSLVYPPLGLVCLIAATSHNLGFKKPFYICTFYFIGFLLGILTIYLLNKVFHGHFGIIPEGWRNYHPIKNISDISVNLKKSLDILKFFMETYSLAITLSISSLIFGFFKKNKKTLPLFVTGAFAFLLDSALVIYSGMDVSDRNFIWPWFYMVICISLLVFNSPDDSNKKTGLMYFIIMLSVFLFGISTWINQAKYYTKVSQYVQLIGSEMDSQKGNTIYTCGTPKYVHAINIKMMVKKIYDIDAIEAPESDCSKITSIGLYKSTDRFYFIYP